MNINLLKLLHDFNIRLQTQHFGGCFVIAGNQSKFFGSRREALVAVKSVVCGTKQPLPAQG